MNPCPRVVQLIAIALLASAWAFSGHAQAARSVDELLKRNDEQFLNEVLFFSTTVSNGTPRADLWRVMDRLQRLRLPDNQQIPHAIQMGYLAQAISRYGAPEDFARLLALTDTTPGGSLERRKLTDALLTAACRHQVQALASNSSPIKIDLPAATTPLPLLRMKASPALLDAAKLYQRITSGEEGQPYTFRTNGWIGIDANWNRFYELISEVLHGTVTNGSQRLLQFQWGSWCGTGIDMFAVPQERALFVAFMQEKNYRAALQKALTMSGDFWPISPSLDDDGAWARQFIARCGFDWEQLYAGAIAVKLPYLQSAQLDALATYGSDKSALFLLDLAANPVIAEQSGFLQAIGNAIGAGDPPLRSNRNGTFTIRFFGQRHFGRPLANTISPELKRKLLAVLEAQLRPGVSADTATVVCQLLRDLGRRESAPALKRAMELPYARVREIASEALSDLGETVPTVERLDPVPFRLLANGQPLANASVNCEVHMAGGRATSTTIVTDDNGITRLNRDWFTDARYPATNITFSAERWEKTAGRWFEIQATPPLNLATVTDLHVKQVPVRVAIHTAAPNRFYRGESIGISMRAERNRSYGKYLDGLSYHLIYQPFTNVLVFPHLQPGRYELNLTLAGSARMAKEFVVGATGAVVELTLERGADVLYEIATPGERSQFVAPEFEIRTSGKLIDRHLYYAGPTNVCRALPVGEYVFRVLSSDEAIRARQRPNEIVPSQRGYRGIEVPFQITENSPKAIDLGVIQLQATE